MLHVAVDDTDSRAGGCTTFLAARLLEAFPDLRPHGFPRLVRLNPQVPWKTRGNAAVSISFSDTLDLDDAARRVERVLRTHARVDAEGTEPGFAVAHEPPHPDFYLRAVRELVTMDDALHALDAAGARAGGLKAQRGVIGAAAALAWPARRATWELIAYREPDRVGTPRRVDPASVLSMQRAFPTTFSSYDETHHQVVMVPRTPCPVLYGLRGTRPEDLPRAAARVRSEPAHEATLFITNQATDDHLTDQALGEARPYTNARVHGRVHARPEHRGGHAFAVLADGAARLRVAAYAPTREFVRMVLNLRPGDEVEAAGGVKPGPDGAPTLALEKLRLVRAARDVVKVANPLCPTCGRRGKSAGHGAGYRCPGCGGRLGEPARQELARGVEEGWHEPPTCARRHLARPLWMDRPEPLSPGRS